MKITAFPHTGQTVEHVCQPLDQNRITTRNGAVVFGCINPEAEWRVELSSIDMLLLAAVLVQLSTPPTGK